MNAKEFYNTVKQMRQAQKKYFQYRTQAMLQESKRLESIIDKEIKRVEDYLEEKNYPRLFN